MEKIIFLFIFIFLLYITLIKLSASWFQFANEYEDVLTLNVKQGIKSMLITLLVCKKLGSLGRIS
jgi:hypothetical protein